MSARGVMSVLVLTVLAAVQFAVLSVPAALVMAGGAGWESLWHSLLAGPAPLAALAAVLAALLLGVPAALALWRLGWGLASGVLLAPLLLPVALLGHGPGAEGLGILLIGHASLGVSLGTLCTLVALGGIDSGLLRAAAHCGVSPAGAYRRVVLPLALPGVMAGLLLSLAGSTALSLLALSLGRTPSLATLLPLGQKLMLSPILAAIGVVLLLCAAMGAALALLRRA